MAVKIRSSKKGGDVYHYRFEIDGRKFSGSTGKTSRREAEKVEAEKRREAEREISADKALENSGSYTIAEACARYWREVGEGHVNHQNTLWSLTWIEQHFGSTTKFESIDDNKVALMVAKRKREHVPQSR